MAGLRLLPELEVTTGRAERSMECPLGCPPPSYSTQPSSGGRRFAVRVANLSFLDAEIGCK